MAVPYDVTSVIRAFPAPPERIPEITPVYPSVNDSHNPSLGIFTANAVEVAVAAKATKSVLLESLWTKNCRRLTLAARSSADVVLVATVVDAALAGGEGKEEEIRNGMDITQ